MNPTQSPPTRREFLKQAGQVAAVAAPYVITSSALGAPGKLSASNRITTALIGSGGRGRQIIAGGDQVVAVCDVDAKHCAAAKNQIDAAGAICLLGHARGQLHGTRARQVHLPVASDQGPSHESFFLEEVAGEGSEIRLPKISASLRICSTNWAY